jgi:hypothetical protein
MDKGDEWIGNEGGGLGKWRLDGWTLGKEKNRESKRCFFWKSTKYKISVFWEKLRTELIGKNATGQGWEREKGMQGGQVLARIVQHSLIHLSCLASSFFFLLFSIFSTNFC